MLCCVLLFFSVVNPSCASSVLQYWQLGKYKLVCHTMILSSRIHQYVTSHLCCSQTIAVLLILVGGKYRTRGSPVFSVRNNFEGRKGSCCVVCCCCFLLSIHPVPVVYFSTGKQLG
jgi:hypothetical protein